MFSNYSKGHAAELKCQLRCAELGWNVAKPMIEDRYDYIIDHPTKGLLKVQVKYCGSQNKYGTYVVDLKKQTRNKGQVKTYSAKEIDALIVYIADVDCLVWLDIKDFEGMTAVGFRKEFSAKAKASKLIADCKF